MCMYVCKKRNANVWQSVLYMTAVAVDKFCEFFKCSRSRFHIERLILLRMYVCMFVCMYVNVNVSCHNKKT